MAEDAAAAPASPAEPNPQTPLAPLDHLRVLDLTAWQAGPLVTMILGDFGADVIKIESARRLDGWRGSAGWMEDLAYERSPIWLAINRSKRGISLDLTTPAGRAIFLRLVAGADVVVENFTPRVMAGFDLSYDVLAEVNERLIMISLSGFGASGPWRDFSAFAFPTEQVSGLTFLNGRPGGPPLAVGQPVTDALAGSLGTFALLAAVLRRERTGRGEHIDLAQVETLTALIGAELIAAQLGEGDPPRRGNDAVGMMPHGVFPCMTDPDTSVAGNRHAWLALAVRHDADWAALCAVMGRDDLAADEELACLTGRLARSAEVDAAVVAWTSGLLAADAAEALQAGGVPASPVMRPSSLMADDQLWERGFYRMIERAEVDAGFFPGPVVRLDATPGGPTRPAPLFGEHTREVLAELAGLSEAELDELEASGVTSRTPVGQDWR